MDKPESIIIVDALEEFVKALLRSERDPDVGSTLTYFNAKDDLRKVLEENL